MQLFRVSLTKACTEDLGHRDSEFSRCFGARSARKLAGHFGPVFAKGIDERDCGIVFEDGAVVLINEVQLLIVEPAIMPAKPPTRPPP